MQTEQALNALFKFEITITLPPFALHHCLILKVWTIAKFIFFWSRPPFLLDQTAAGPNRAAGVFTDNLVQKSGPNKTGVNTSQWRK